MGPEQAQEILKLFGNEFKSVILPTGLFLLFLYAAKDFVANVFEYFRILIDKNVGKGVLVEVDGTVQGIITSITFQHICVEDWMGDFHKYPVVSRRKHTWVFPKINVKEFFIDHNRRKKALLEEVDKNRRKK